jgi:hypothetical protein
LEGEHATTIMSALLASVSARGQRPVTTWEAAVRRALQFTSGIARLRPADFNEAGAMTVKELVMLIASQEEEDPRQSSHPMWRDELRPLTGPERRRWAQGNGEEAGQ